MTLSTMACVTRIRDTSGSGGAATRRSKLSSDQVTKPSGGFLRCTLRSFLGSSPALAVPRILDGVFRGLDHDVAGGVVPGPAGTTGDLMELPSLQRPLS